MTMTVIIAARFESISDVEAAKGTLRRAGFRDDEFQSFFVGPPGRHDLYPVGGDAHHDEGTKKSGRGAILLASVGAACGLALGGVGAYLMPDYWLPALVAGAGIGAYVGALVGALGAARGGKGDQASREEPVEEPGGIRLAVNADRPFGVAMALAALKRHGAQSIVKTEGDWKDGGWQDFDPRVPLSRGSAGS
jgi:hypothetical protein